MFGYPVPTVPPEVLKGCRDTIGFLSQGSSVDDYAMVEEKLAAKDGQPTEKASGYLQREFKVFVDEKDPEHEWAGMKRIFLDEGTSIWCCARCCTAIEQNPTASFEELREIVGSPLVDPSEEEDGIGGEREQELLKEPIDIDLDILKDIGQEDLMMVD